jgi:tetratricopeptide (TPR) repeat protein
MKALLPLTLVIALLTPAAWTADNLEGFAKTYAEAQKAAKATGRPMYLHFTTTWCTWCRKIEADDYANPEGKKALADFVTASLDCTVPKGEQPAGEAKINIQLMQKFGGNGYPFLAILTPEGDLLHSWAGYAPLPQFELELKKSLANYKEYKSFVAYAAKADKSGYEYNAKAMDIYSKMMRMDAAVDAAKLVRKLDPKDENGDAAMATLIQIHAALVAQGETKDLLADLKKFDGANEKGLLEQGYWDVAATALNTGKLDRGIALIVELTSSAKTLNQAQQIYGTLGMVYAQQGKMAEAGKALDKAIAANPDSPVVERLRALQTKIRETRPQPQ